MMFMYLHDVLYIIDIHSNLFLFFVVVFLYLELNVEYNKHI